MGASSSTSALRTVTLINVENGQATAEHVNAVLEHTLGKRDQKPLTLRSGNVGKWRGGIMLTVPTAIGSPCVDGIKPMAQIWAVLRALRENEAYRGEQILWSGLVQVDRKDLVLVLTSLGQLLLLAISKDCGCIERYGGLQQQMNVMKLLAAFVTGGDVLQLVFDGGMIVDIASTIAAAAELFRLIWLLHTIGTGRQTLQHNMPVEQLPSTQLPPISKDGGLHTSYMMHATAQGIAAPEFGSDPATGNTTLRSFQTFPGLKNHVEKQAKKAMAENGGGACNIDTNTALAMIRQGLPLLTLHLSTEAMSWKPECVGPLASALRFNDTIKAVVAENDPRLGPHLQRFAETLKTNTSILKLVLANCGINSPCAAAFGAAIQSNPLCRLAELDLRLNAVGDAGAVALAAAFCTKPNSLVKLDLSNCGIDVSGVTALLNQGLQCQKNLEHLILTGNNFGASGSAALMPAISRLSALAVLGLGQTNLVPASISARVSPRHGAKLTTLDISGAADDVAVLAIITPFPPKLTHIAVEAPSLLAGIQQLATTRAEEGASSKNDVVLDITGGNKGNTCVQTSFALLLSLVSARGFRGFKCPFAFPENCSMFWQMVSAATPASGILRELSFPMNIPLLQRTEFAPVARAQSPQAALEFCRAVISGAPLPQFLSTFSLPYTKSQSLTNEVALPDATPDGCFRQQFGRESHPQPPANGQKTFELTYTTPIAAFHNLTAEPVKERVSLGLVLADLLAGRKNGAHFNEPGQSPVERISIAAKNGEQSKGFGPSLCIVFRLGLEAPGCRLTFMDISGNGMGDEGAEALGRALRVNRTLTALRFDRNGVGFAGLKAIRGAFYGNTKIRDMPLPDADISATLHMLGRQYKQALEQEIQGRSTVKAAYAGMWQQRPPFRPRMKDSGLAMLIGAKKSQAAARSTKNQLRTAIAQIEASVKRNKRVFQVKKAAKLAQAQAKAAAQVLALASKVEAKAAQKKQQNVQKVWARRCKLLQQWRILAGREKFKAAQAAGTAGAEDSGGDTWVDKWAMETGNRFLTPEALPAIIDAIPQGQKEVYQQMIENSNRAFASEASLGAELQDLQLQQQIAMKEHRFFLKEAEYHSRQQNAPIPVVLPHVAPGIVPVPSPGTVTALRDFRHIPTASYHQRYVYIQAQLQVAASRPAPPDYSWTAGSGQQLVVPLAQAPMITYPPVAPMQNPPPMTAPLAPMFNQPPGVVHVPGANQALGVVQQPIVCQPGPQTIVPSLTPLAPTTSFVPPTTGFVPPTTGFVPPTATPVYAAAYAKPLPVAVGVLVSAPPASLGLPVQQQTFSYQVPQQVVDAHHRREKKRREQEEKQRRRNQHNNNDDYYMYSGYYYSSSYHDYHSYNHHHRHYHEMQEQDRPFHHQNFQEPLDESYVDAGAVPEEVEVLEIGDEGDFEIGDSPPDDFDEGEFEGGFDEEAMMEMYASAGPRDLPGSDDKDPGSSTTAMLAGARARDSKKETHVYARKDKAVFRHLRAIRQRFSTSALQVGMNSDAPAIDDMWDMLEQEAQDAVYGSTAALDYHILPSAFPQHTYLAERLGFTIDHQQQEAASDPLAGMGVTLVTQLSLDRLPQFEAQVNAWDGPVSAAVYIPFPWSHATSASKDFNSEDMIAAVKKVAAAYNRIVYLDGKRRLDRSLGSKSELTISLLWANEPGVEEQGQHDYASAYPVNALRNLALRTAKTDLVLLLDVDFIPSAGAHDAIANNKILCMHAIEKNVAFVLPAFESKTIVPREKQELAAFWHRQEGGVSAFHVQHFAKGHQSTDYSRWFAVQDSEADFSYSVDFHEYYEPYVVMSRTNVPDYDERFRGYGMNKISHLFSIAAQGTSFKVLNSHFVVALEHAKSESWKKQFTGGALQSLIAKARIANLYRRFKDDVNCAQHAYAQEQIAKQLQSTTAPLQHLHVARQVPVQLPSLSTGKHRTVFFDKGTGTVVSPQQVLAIQPATHANAKSPVCPAISKKDILVIVSDELDSDGTDWESEGYESNLLDYSYFSSESGEESAGSLSDCENPDSFKYAAKRGGGAVQEPVEY